MRREVQEAAGDWTLADVAEATGLPADGLSFSVDGEFIPRERWTLTAPTPGQSIILSTRPGGIEIGLAVAAALEKAGRPLAEVREVATIDLKAREPGLLEWCAQQDLPLRVITREHVQERPWVTQGSDWVKANVGVEGVCEPCALLATHRGKLLVPKTPLNGVAVAVVEENCFL
jgi:sulfur carrier protein ThiS